MAPAPIPHEDSEGSLWGYGSVVFVVVMLYLLYGVVIPGVGERFNARQEAARRLIQEGEALQLAAKAAEARYSRTYAPACLKVKAVEFRSAAALYDRLMVAGTVKRKYGPVKVSVSRREGSGSASYLQFLYPDWQFVLYRIELEGPSADVIDYLHKEVDCVPFAQVVDLSVSVPTSQSSWPRYQLSVWFPVKKGGS